MHLKKWVRNSMMVGGVVFTALYLWWSAFNLGNMAIEGPMGFWVAVSATMWVVLTALLGVLVIYRGITWFDDNAIGDEIAVWFEHHFMEADDDEGVQVVIKDDLTSLEGFKVTLKGRPIGDGDDDE